jgi:amino acid transporter
MPKAKTHLTRLDGIAIVVGIVVGMGIFRAPSVVADAAGSPGAALALWALGGVVTLLGALAYAELAAAYPSSGGEYDILKRAYGRRVAALFGWARLSVIQPGTIAAAGFVLGDYLTPFVALGPFSTAIYAAIATLIITFINLRGLRLSAGAQTALSSFLVFCLVGLIVLGLAAPASPTPPPPAAIPPAAAIGFAMIFVLLTYGGWNEAAYLSGETRAPQSDMRVILFVGTVLVTILYLAVNAVYFRVLGFEAVAGSSVVGADLARAELGDAGAVVVTLFVIGATLSTMNGTLFTGARSAQALGRDAPALAAIGRWNHGGDNPAPAVLAQAAACFALVGLGAFGKQGFETMVAYTAPVFWLFFMLTALAAIILRLREPDAPRPFRMPLYPLPVVGFVMAAGYMLYSSVTYAGSQAFTLGAGAGLAVLALGAAYLAFTGPGARRPTPQS